MGLQQQSGRLAKTKPRQLQHRQINNLNLWRYASVYHVLSGSVLIFFVIGIHKRRSADAVRLDNRHR